jgi:hypothetical protein
MSNVLSEHKRQQVLALGRLGWPLRRIEEETGVRRETASTYLRAAGIAVRRVGRPTAGPPESKPAIAAEVSTDSEPIRPSRAPTVSACEPYRELIVEAIGRGRNAMAIWQDLVDAHGFVDRYPSVRRFVKKLRGSVIEPRAIITTAPGEEGQVDYGDGPMVRDPQSGKYRRTRLFVFTLGYSRKSVRLRGKSPRCLPKSGPRSARCPSSRFATTASGPAPCTILGVLALAKETRARDRGRCRTRRARDGRAHVSLRATLPRAAPTAHAHAAPRPGSSCASMPERRAAGVVWPTPIAPNARRRRQSHSWRRRGRPAPPSGRSAITSIDTTVPSRSDGFSASSAGFEVSKNGRF